MSNRKRPKEHPGVATEETSVKAVAERLRLTRLAMGLSQAAFCQLAGISPQAFNNYERGRQRPELDKAIALCRAHKLTLDWVYMGDPSGLPYTLAAAIADLRKKPR